MKFLLTLAVWIVTAAIVLFFFAYRGAEKGGEYVRTIAKEREITVEITPTFSTAKDPFVLDVGEKTKGFSVILDGKKVFEADEGVTKGVPLVLNALNISGGKHEVAVNAVPPAEGGANAVRIKVLEGGLVIAEDTKWFEDGQDISAALMFDTGKEQ